MNHANQNNHQNDLILRNAAAQRSDIDIVTQAPVVVKSVLGRGLRSLSLLLLGALFLIAAPLAHANSIYVGQAATGGSTGADCSNTVAASYFNNGANWGTGASQIGPGTTVFLCGTITTRLVAQGNGSASGVVTVQWTSGASLQVCSSTDAFDISGKSYLLLDLGGNTAAITCPNNGTGLSSNVNAIGVGDGGNNASHIEVRNGTIGPLYQYTCCGSDGVGSFSITLQSGTGNHFHDLSLNNSNEGIHQGYGNGISTSGNEIDHNTFARSVGRAIEYANGYGQSTTDTGTLIHDNDITLGSGWESGSGDYTHIEAILTYNDGSSGSDTLTGMKIYNNYIHGNPTCCTSAYISVYNGLSCPSTNSSWSGAIFNNLLVDNATSGSNTGYGDGMIYMQDCHHTLQVYNNILDAGPMGHSQGLACVEFEGTNTVTFQNNICMNANSMITNQDGAPKLTANNNDYYNPGSGGANGWSWNSKETTTLAAWQSSTGQDAQSSSANPGLNSDYTIASASSAAYQFGSNLTSMTIAQLDAGKPIAVGMGNDSVVGALRSATGSWDLGVYPFSSVSQSAPAPPTGLAVVSVQ